MSDRLTELQRQRALLQEHLAWLDREIAAAGNPTAPASLTPERPAPGPVSVPQLVETPQEMAGIGEAFNTDAKNAALSARKGCFVVFFLALAFVLVAFAGIYLYSVSHYGKKSPAKTTEIPNAPARP